MLASQVLTLSSLGPERPSVLHPLAAVRQRLREGVIVVAHDFEVDDETRLGVEALAAAVTQEFLNTFGHSTLPNGPSDGTRSNDSRT